MLSKQQHAQELIQQRSLSNRQIAMRVGVDEKTIRRWRGKGMAPTPDATEQIEAIADGVIRARGNTGEGLNVPRLPVSHDTQQIIFVADPHLSKLCWPGSTGEDPYDLSIARKLVLGGVRNLAGREGMCTSRVLVFLGDYFHYDNLIGTTTAGTGQDRDSRLPKMLDVGAEVAVQSINYCAMLGDVKVILVAGNHDAVLTTALQRILVGEFKNDERVSVDATHTLRKYHEFGKNGFMFNHGDRRKKELPSTFATEQPKLWGRTTHREIHTGHLHNEIEQFNGTLTHHGCIVRTHPSMSPPDQWHSDEQYIGSARGMMSYTYDRDGGVLASHTASPRLLLQ